MKLPLLLNRIIVPSINYRNTLSAYRFYATMSSEYKVASISEIKDGEMKEVKINDNEKTTVLLYNVKGEYFVTSPKCTHYGAPLKNGVLNAKGVIRCPWHGAAFNVKNGDIEDYPGLDALNSFPTTIKENAIYITADKETLESFSKKPCQADKKEAQSAKEEHILIVGGGAGGYATLQSLRTAGYGGKITVLSKESYLPIDRTKLSKALITEPSKIALRDEAFYKDFDIDVILSTEVTKINTSSNEVETSNGSKFGYTTLVLATGGVPKNLPLPGFNDLKNIFLLRGIEQAKSIVDARDTAGGKKKIVIVGSSFIGTEAAAALAKDHEVHVIGMEKVPFERVLGEKIGAVLQKVHEKSGVKFYMNASVEKAVPKKDDPSTVGGIQLKDGQTLEADFVISAVGVGPATNYLKESGFSLEKDGSIKVDGHLKVKGYDNIFAIGDIATYPYINGNDIRIEHWNVAMNHGKSVGETIAGKKNETYKNVPVFWSAQGGQLRYCGSGAIGYDDVVIKGEPEEAKFAGFYTQGENVVAVVSMGMDPIVSKSTVLMESNEMVSKSDLQKGVDISKL